MIGKLTDLTFLRLGLINMYTSEVQEFAFQMSKLRSLEILDVYFQFGKLPKELRSPDEEDQVLRALSGEAAGNRISTQQLLETVEGVKGRAKAGIKKKQSGELKNNRN